MTTTTVTPAAHWRISADRTLSLDQPRLLGILNVTPDSFSDGGRNLDPNRALENVHEMIRDGADIIDVGGQSTRPGAQTIPIHEELRRTIPIVQRIRESHPSILISIDTTRQKVASEALDAGAEIVNDVSAGTEDPGMLGLIAERSCAVILMHRLAPPALDRYSNQYNTEPNYNEDATGVVGVVSRFLQSRVNEAISRGIPPASISIDPGLGFGKSVSQNFQLIGSTREFVQLGFPVLCAASRKSFICPGENGPPPAQRAAGSVAIAVWEYFQGVRLFRIHDVREHAQALAAAESIRRHAAPDLRSA